MPKKSNYTAITAERSLHRTEAQELAQRGLAILVRNNVAIKKVLGKLNTPPSAVLETLGVRVALAKGDVDLWNIYRTPARDHRDADLHLDKWPTGEQVIILSDANCHGSWDKILASDALGESLDEWAADNNFLFLNSGPTRWSSIGAGSSPGVTKVSASKAHVFSWKTLDSIGSDNLPILLSTNDKKQKDKPSKKLNFRKTDWRAFRTACEKQFSDSWPEQSPGKDCKLVLLPVKDCKLVQSGQTHHSFLVRKNFQALVSCTEAKRKYNAAHKLLQRNRQNQTAIEECSAVRSDLEETIRIEKAASWRNFVNEFLPSTPETKAWNTIRSMDGRSKQSLPGTPLVENGKEYVTDKQKADATVGVYATISHTKILRENSKAPYKTVRTKLPPAIHLQPQLD